MARLLADDFVVQKYDIADSATTDGVSLAVALSAPVIFYCVPISKFEEIIKEHSVIFAKMSPQHRSETLLIDTLSVKMHPRKVFTDHLPTEMQAMLTHPMFGPDSSKDGFAGQTIVIDHLKASDENFSFWQDYFKSKLLKVLLMSADEHDKLAASGQGITHLVARVLEAAQFRASDIDPGSTRTLLELQQQLCRDQFQLFQDLQSYNPYAAEARQNFADSLASVLEGLNEKRSPDKQNW